MRWTADDARQSPRGRIGRCGLAGLDRQLRPVAATYSGLAHAGASGQLEPIGSRTSLGYRREERELAA
jgi:hypothetical protein